MRLEMQLISEKQREDLDNIESGIMNVYKENLKEGVEIEEIQQLVDAETWLSGEEAEKYFKIEVVEAKEVALVVVITLINIRKHLVK